MSDLEVRVLMLEKLVEDQRKIISTLSDRLYEVQEDIRDIDRLNDTFLLIHEQNAVNTNTICNVIDVIKSQTDDLWQDYQMRLVNHDIAMNN